MGTVRAPNRPASVTGVRPDIRIIGTCSQAALIAPIAPFASPTLVCSITACARPVISQTPCAMLTAACSCGQVIARGRVSPRAAASVTPSITGGKSVPELAKT